MNDILSTIIALAIIFPFAIWFSKVADRASLPQKDKQKIKKDKTPAPQHPVFKTLLFIGFALLYLYWYGMQGFMSFSPAHWPLALFMISALVILCSHGKLQYGLVIVMAILAISIDSGAFLVPASDGYHHTSVMSIILIPYWLICIAMNNSVVQEIIEEDESSLKKSKK